MKITRNNYEEYFLLYVDNELSQEDRKAVEAFVLLYPDLEEELTMLQQSVIKPAQRIVFEQKELLFKTTAEPDLVNEANHEEFFVLYTDDELNNEEKARVEEFVYRHPQYQAEFELVQAARLEADHSVVFPDKASLYREEKDDKVVPFRWWRLAVAAAVLVFIAGTVFLINNQRQTPGPTTAAVQPSGNPPATTQPGNSTDALAQQSEPAGKSSTNTNHEKNSVNPSQVVKPEAHQLAYVQAKKSTDAVQPGKINTISSNLPRPDAVIPSETVALVDNSNTIKTAAVAPAVIQAKGGIDIKEGKKEIVDKPFGEQQSNPDAVYTLASNDNNNQIEFLNTSINKKNKLRGLFRKVTRVFEKTTNIGPDDNENRGIHIANFEIALK